MWGQYNPISFNGQNLAPVVDIAPTLRGVAYALAAAVDSNGGHQILFADLNGIVRTEGGSGISMSSNDAFLYVAGPTGGIYKAAITPTAPDVTFDRPVLYVGKGDGLNCGNAYDYCLAYEPVTIFADQANGNPGPFQVVDLVPRGQHCHPLHCNFVTCTGDVIEAQSNGAGGPKSIDIFPHRPGRAVLIAARHESAARAACRSWVTTVSTGITFSALAGAQIVHGYVRRRLGQRNRGQRGGVSHPPGRP